MARVPWISATGQTSVAIGTHYIVPGLGTLSSSTTEESHQAPIRHAGIVSRLRVRIETNDRTADSTLRSRKNTANGNLTITIGAGLTGDFEDLTNSDSITTGDLYNYELVVGSGGASFVPRWITAIYDATDGFVVLHMGTTTQNVSVASTTRYFRLAAVGGGAPSITEVESQAIYNAPGILRYLSLYVSANARVNTTTFRTRLDAADGNSVISVGSGATGLFEDLTNSDVLTGGEKVALSVTTGSGTQTLTLQNIKIETLSTDGVVGWLGYGAPTWSAATTYFRTIVGSVGTTPTDVTGNRVSTGEAATYTGLNSNILTNGVTAASTITLMAGGVAQTNTISVPSTTTGFFEDTTHSDDLGAADELNYKIVAGATGTSITARNIGLKVDYPTPPDPFVTVQFRAAPT